MCLCVVLSLFVMKSGEWPLICKSYSKLTGPHIIAILVHFGPLLVWMWISKKKMNSGNHLFQDIHTYLKYVKSCRNKISMYKIGGKFKKYNMILIGAKFSPRICFAPMSIRQNSKNQGPIGNFGVTQDLPQNVLDIIGYHFYCNIIQPSRIYPNLSTYYLLYMG